MELKDQIKSSNGDVYGRVYRDEDPDTNLREAVLRSCHWFCFYGDKFVVVHNAKGYWTPPGGSIEPGETWQEALIREIKEESNMKVLHHQYIGYQDIDVIKEEGRIVRQTRSFCIIEPYGDFVSDPDQDIDRIELIDPLDYKQYFDWGAIGDEVMRRAVEMKKEWDTKEEYLH